MKTRLTSLAVVVVILLIGAAWAGAAQSPTPGAPPTDKPIKIGLLLPYTSISAGAAQEADRGARLYLEEFQWKMAGRPVELIAEDTQIQPSISLTKAKKLIEKDNVDFLIGETNGAACIAIRDYVHSQGTPWIATVCQPPPAVLGAKAASPSIFWMASTPYQAGLNMGRWVREKTRHQKVGIIASDFATGHGYANAFKAGFEQAGGQIVQELYPALGTSDFGPFISGIDPTKMEAVYAWLVSADALRFLKQFSEYGLKARLPVFGFDALVEDQFLASLGQTAKGVIVSSIYHHSLNNPENRRFVNAYKARYNLVPGFYAESSYDALRILNQALEATKGNTLDRARLVTAIHDTQWNLARGPVQFDSLNMVTQNVYVVQVEEAGGQMTKRVIDVMEKVSSVPKQ